MRDYLVVIGQVLQAEGTSDRFNINFYKVKGESEEEVKNKIQRRVDFWEGLKVDVYVMEVIDLEETSKLKREVEFIGNYWLMPRG